MNPFVALIAGLLIGWLVEWVIDWVYWRRKAADRQTVTDTSTPKRVAELEQEVASYKDQLARLQTDLARDDTPAVVSRAQRSNLEPLVPAVQKQQPDHLDEITWVTPAVLACLNEAGIFTYAELGKLQPQKLKSLLAGQELQPGNEVDIVKQARLRAGTIKKVDKLEVIIGIGPVIATTLNAAGIFTFAELSALTPTGLREIVGDRIQRLANEEQILAQARKFAEEQSWGG